MRLYLTSHEPWNTSYCTEQGHILYKVVCPTPVGHHMTKARTATIYRARPNVPPTSSQTLWAERHFTTVETPNPVTTTHLNAGVDTDFGIKEEDRKEGVSHAPGHERTKSFESQGHDHEFNWPNPIPSQEELDRLASEAEDGTSFSKLAEIEFHTIHSTKIHYKEKELKTSDFFRTEGSGKYGKNRIFKGPDGKEYVWHLGERISELLTVEHDDKNSPNHAPLLVARLHDPHNGIPNEKGPASLEIFGHHDDLADLIMITFVYIEKLRRDRRTSIIHSNESMGAASVML